MHVVSAALGFAAGFVCACALMHQAPSLWGVTLDWPVRAPGGGGRQLEEAGKPYAHQALSPSRCPPSPQEASVLFRLANTRHSDKTSRHAYHVAYGGHLAPFLGLPVRLLEIGVQDGPSLTLWSNLFPNRRLLAGIAYGQGRVTTRRFKEIVKLNPRKASRVDNNATIYRGDQSDSIFLQRVEDDLAGQRFDVIIDDGSHVPLHQISTLARIFDQWLAEGGVYVIEDLETSYWDAPGGGNIYGREGYSIHAGIGSNGSAVEKLKQIVDVINRKFLDDVSYSVLLPGRADQRVASISFARNCAILTKKRRAEWDFVDQKLDSGDEHYRPEALDPARSAFKAFIQARVGGPFDELRLVG